MTALDDFETVPENFKSYYRRLFPQIDNQLIKHYFLTLYFKVLYEQLEIETETGREKTSYLNAMGTCMLLLPNHFPKKYFYANFLTRKVRFSTNQMEICILI